MIKLKIIIFLLLLISVINGFAAYAKELQDTIVNEEVFIESIAVREEIADTAVFELTFPEYEAWEKVSVQGKLKMNGLPLSPSLKIFMIKDSLINISIRAPFVGEAARIDISPDSITAVNKMKKNYVKEGISDFLKFYPGGISDLQSLILARFFLPGLDDSIDNIEEYIEIYHEDGQFNVIPKGDAEIDGIKYGFVVDNDFNPLVLMVLPENRPDMEIYAVYTYGLQGYNIELTYQDGERVYEATLELKDPEWKGDIPKEIDLNKKYKRLSIREFLRSF